MKQKNIIKESLDKQIIDLFYGGLSISDISKDLKESIQFVDSSVKKPAHCKDYVSQVIYRYQLGG